MNNGDRHLARILASAQANNKLFFLLQSSMFVLFINEKQEVGRQSI